MTDETWLGLSAWGWFALLAVAGQYWPLAGSIPRKGLATTQRVVTNIGLGIGYFGLGLVMPATAIFAAIEGQAGRFGLLHQFDIPPWPRVALAFLLSDLLLWAIHWLAHRWPTFWRLHRVHHSDAELDVLTTYRQHPLTVPAVAVLQGGGIALLGLDPTGVAAYQAVLAFHLPLHHANLDWRLPPGLARTIGWVFMRPSQHALHHSALPEETDSNYGELLSVWDRLAGTLRDEGPEHVRRLRLGLGPRYDRGAEQIGRQLALPFDPLAGPAAE